MTCIVSNVGIKAMSCDSPNNGNVLLILGQALLTPVTAVVFLPESAEKLYFPSEEDQRTCFDSPLLLRGACCPDLLTTSR